MSERLVRVERWYEHELIDGRWEHAYDAYLNHPASGARAPKRGVSTDFILCNCTDEQRRQHMDGKNHGSRTGQNLSLEAYCGGVRDDIKKLEKDMRSLKDQVTRERGGKEDSFVGQTGEILGQITLAFRALEDARMRVGKVIQYGGDGVSCFDK